MADSLQQKDVAMRVVRWHNRHWLARRIKASDVNSIGVVVMPWAPGTGAPPDHPTPSGWKAWPARIQQAAMAQVARLRRGKKPQETPTADGHPAEPGSDPPGHATASGLVPAFTEEFAPGLTHEQIVPFARTHGLEDSPAPDDWPRRQISPQSDVVEVWLYLLTAGINVEHHRPRLLLGARPDDPILGRRVLCPKRVMAAVLGPVMLVSMTGLGIWWGSASGSKGHDGAPHVSAGASAASAPVAEPAHRASEQASAPTESAGSAPEASSASASEPSASADAHADHAANHAASGSHGPAAASAETAASRSDHAATPPSTSARSAAPPSSAQEGHSPAGAKLNKIALPPKPEPDPPAEVKGLQPILKDAPAPATDAGQHFALMSRGPRSRAAAQEMVPRMEAAARNVDKTDLPPEARIEVMETRGSWHAVWWPFPDRQSATQARWALALKGITVDLVAF